MPYQKRQPKNLDCQEHIPTYISCIKQTIEGS